MEQNKIALLLLCAVVVVGVIGTMASIMPSGTGAATTYSSTYQSQYPTSIDLTPRYTQPVNSYYSRTNSLNTYPQSQTIGNPKYQSTSSPVQSANSAVPAASTKPVAPKPAQKTASCRPGEIVYTRSIMNSQIRSAELAMYGEKRVYCRVSDPGPYSNSVCCKEYIRGGGPFVWTNGKSYNKAWAWTDTAGPDLGRPKIVTVAGSSAPKTNEAAPPLVAK